MSCRHSDSNGASALSLDLPLARNLESVRERMAAAAARVGVPVPDLLAVTKSCDDDTFREMLALGVSAVGENRARQCEARHGIITDGGYSTAMHFIGTLQKNKVKYIIGRIALLHSLDSLSLAEEIDRLSEKNGLKTAVLLEVNSGREPNKGGVMPEEIDRFADEIARFENLSVQGLMTMAPNLESAEEYRPYFRETRCAFERLSSYFDTNTPILSMGMTDSFEVAIEEGATIVRVGSALFAH